MSLVPSRVPVRTFPFSLEPNLPVRRAADLLVLNSCRRADGAGYLHGDRRGCLRGTRETVLNDIEPWAKDSNKSPVFWLNGLAGTGKSTIAQTVSERFFADGLLGASFFCSRDFKDRSDLHFIFPTLAFQLAHKYPTFRSALVPLLRSNPDIAFESLYNQMGKLIAGPLESAGISTVIVIDALDECKDEEPSSAVLSVLGRFVGQIPSVKFFITGRPEPRIKTGFRLPLLEDATKVFVLHDVHPSLVNNDIQLFLKHELSELARRHQLEGWPSDERISLLCHRAAGLFVYAVATVKFLDSNTHLPERRLDMIIDSPNCTVPEGRARFKHETTLDSLYTSVLKTAFSVEDPEVDSKVRSTIGAVVLLVNPLPPSGVAGLIGLIPREVIQFLTLVQSLFALDDDFDQPVKPFHKSFPDFVTDPSRCLDKRFHISPENLHLELAMNCLRVMNEGLKRNLLSLPNYALNSEIENIWMRIETHTSIALRYASQSWHHHLAAARGDVTDVVSRLHLFLREKFLAWLEVVSVLGAVRGAVAGLEELMPWIQKVCFGCLCSAPNTKVPWNQVTRDEQLLDIAKDCFNFATRFFEPINISAPHIYHSALELSPLSSTVRKFYHHQRLTPFPRVGIGIPDSWDPSTSVSSADYTHESSITWSPCGQFVVTQTKESVETRDVLTFELTSTLQPTEPTSQLTGTVAYSPDGRSLACASNIAIVVWDIQTGGVVKEIHRNKTVVNSLVWSLDGKSISTVGWDRQEGINGLTVRYDVALGIAQPPMSFQSQDDPHLWAHDDLFRIMTTVRDDEACTIDILEVGSALTKIESFPIQLGGRDSEIKSFSPSTYRTSVWVYRKLSSLLILDIRTSKGLLDKGGAFASHCFSSEGSLFAASREGSVHIWKYDTGHYFPWGVFPSPAGSSPHFLFSPTSPSVLGHFRDVLKLWRLSDLSVAPTTQSRQLGTFSYSGAYMVTARRGGCTVTLTNILSQTPSQFIDTNVEIFGLGLAGSVLLVMGPEAVVAWLMTEDGLVNGVFGNSRAGLGDSIWTVSTSLFSVWDPIFSVKGENGVIKSDGDTPHVYNTRTGAVFEHTQVPAHSNGPWYSLSDIARAWHRPYDYTAHNTPPKDDWGTSRIALKEGWVKNREGKHLLWLPVEWRVMERYGVRWFSDIATMRFLSPQGEPVIAIKLY